MTQLTFPTIAPSWLFWLFWLFADYIIQDPGSCSLITSFKTPGAAVFLVNFSHLTDKAFPNSYGCGLCAWVIIKTAVSNSDH